MRHWTVAAVLAVLISRSAGARLIELDIPYIDGVSAKQRLDIYAPDGHGFATVVYIHGGTPHLGDRKDEPHAAIARNFQASGIAAVVISYRLLGDAVWPAAARDTAAAVAWVKRNIGARGGDPAKIFLVGHSSGAQLAVLISTDATYLQEAGFLPHDVAGTVAISSLLEDPLHVHEWPAERVTWLFATNPGLKYFGSPEEWVRAWPMQHVHDAMPPILILVAGSGQKRLPMVSDAERFVARALEAGCRASFEVLENRTHMSAMEGLANADDPGFLRIRQFVTLTR
jgi:acetyl esterase/lipase